MIHIEKLLVSTSSFLKWFTKKTSAWVTVFRPAVFFTPRALRNFFCTQNSNVKLRPKPTSAATVLRRDACRNSVNVLSPCFIHYRSVKHLLFQTSQVFHHSHVHWGFFKTRSSTSFKTSLHWVVLDTSGTHAWAWLIPTNHHKNKRNKRKQPSTCGEKSIVEQQKAHELSWIWYQTPKIQILKTCF